MLELVKPGVKIYAFHGSKTVFKLNGYIKKKNNDKVLFWRESLGYVLFVK